MAVLRERWPNYENDVGASLFSPRRRVLDWRVRRAYAGEPPLPRLLCWEDAAADTGAAQVYRCGCGRDGLWLQSPGGDAALYERLADASVAAGCSAAEWRASFARLLQCHAIDRITGALPAEFGRVAADLAIDTTTSPAPRPFGTVA